MHIDEDIRVVELRLAHRRHLLERTAQLAKHRASKTIFSPAGILGAAGLGLLAVVGLVRKKSPTRYVYARRQPASKLTGVASVLASVVFALMRAQFGSPAQMAQLVLSKMKKAPQHPQYGRS
jgi:hypothetical protein